VVSVLTSGFMAWSEFNRSETSGGFRVVVGFFLNVNFLLPDSIAGPQKQQKFSFFTARELIKSQALTILGFLVNLFVHMCTFA